MPASAKSLPLTHKRLLAYAHPLREEIFTILGMRTASPAEITRQLGLERKDLPNVTHHTKYLVELGCVELVEERQDAGSLPEKFYKAAERALVDIGEWEALREETPGLAEHLIGRFMQVQLADYIAAVRARTVGDDESFHMTRTRRVLDVKGMKEGMDVYERCRREMDEVERRSAERRHEDGSDALHVSACLGLFAVPAPT